MLKSVRSWTVRAGAGLLAAGVLVGTACTGPASAAAEHGHEAVQAVLDSAVTTGGLPGIVTEIREDGRSWFGTAGVADLDTGQPRFPADRFRIGSTTKTFVATVLLQLVAEHRVGLDDSVQKWLPGLVEGNGYDGSKITIRELLNMTSGVYNYAEDAGVGAEFVGLPFLTHRFDSFTPAQTVELGIRNPPNFQPGQGWHYSDTNYTLAGMIIERATGDSLADEIARRIAQPLHLTATYLPVGNDPTIHGPHGRYYSKLMLPGPDATIYDVTEQNPTAGWAAGGIISTVGDLDRYFGALVGGQLLPPAQQREMLQMLPTKQWIPDTEYGLGLAQITLSCTTVYGMGGAIDGSWTYTFGSRDGRHMMSTNVNGDWNQPISIFTNELEAEFCHSGS